MSVHPVLDPAGLLQLGTATLGESGANQLADAPKPMWPGAALAGRVRPVRCSPGDNLGIHVAVTVAEPGDVLVVDVGSRYDLGYWGEVLTVAALARGVVGLVIDACIRDLDALERRRFAVFARGTALPGASKVEPGALDRPIMVGGIEFTSGDWVVADRDGIVVVPIDRAADILRAAHERTDAELTMFDRLTAGATTVELLGLDASPIERAR